MKKLLKLFLLVCFFSIAIFLYPVIEKHIWYQRIVLLKKQEESLIQAGNDVALFVTRKLLHSNELSLKYKGLQLCSKFNSQSLLEDILPFINNEDSTLNRLGLKALSLIADSSSIKTLTRIAKRSDVRTRLGILQILSEMKEDESVVKQIAFFQNDPSWVVRMTFCDELVKFPYKATIIILKKLLSDNSFQVAYSAAISLGELGVDNEFVEIFSHLKPKTHWTEKFLALRLLTLFPEKMVSLLAASHIESSNNFLAVAALEWMIAKGDERDFSLIVTKTQNKPVGIVKFVAMKALAYLAHTAGKESAVIVTLMKHFRLVNEDLNAYLIQGLKHLGNSIATDEIIKFIDHPNLNLSYEAIVALGAFAKESYYGKILDLIGSPHSKLREASYLALINYENVGISKITPLIKQCKTEKEIFAMGLFLYFHATHKEAYNILLKQYKQSKNRNMRIRFLEMIATVSSKVSNLDLIKQIGSKNLPAWERAKTIMNRCPIEKITTSAFADGFRYYIQRQPKDVGFSLMSFSSASKSFWKQKDILYIAGRENNKGGRFEGIFLYEDYNSYWCTIKGDEILQMNKEKISNICFSPLSEMIVLKSNLNDFNHWFNLAIKRKKWFVAGFFIQKAMIRIEILKTEIKNQPVALKAIMAFENKWINNIQKLDIILKENNLIKVAKKYIALKEAVASEIKALDPEEAKKREQQADEYFSQGIDFLKVEKYENSIIKFKKALNIWPFHKGALREIGTAYAKQLDFDKALEFYIKLQSNRENDIDLLNNISIIYREKKDYKNALRYLTQEIEIDPAQSRGRIDAAQVLMDLDRWNDAIEILESGLNITKDKFSLHQALAKMYRDENDLDKSIYHMQQCIEIKPQDSESLTYLSFLYFSSLKVDLAVKTIKIAIAYDISYIPARLTLADIYISEGLLKDAEEEIRKILVIDPSNEDAKALLDNIS